VNAVPDVLIRDLDPRTLADLKASARSHGRTLQAELHDILRQARTSRLAETRRLSARWLKRLRASQPAGAAPAIGDDRQESDAR
jgi:plasmid stability protein